MMTQCDYLGAPECPCFRVEPHKHQRVCDSLLVTVVICYYILWLLAACVMMGFMLISGPLQAVDGSGISSVVEQE